MDEGTTRAVGLGQAGGHHTQSRLYVSKIRGARRISTWNCLANSGTYLCHLKGIIDMLLAVTNILMVFKAMGQMRSPRVLTIHREEARSEPSDA